MANNTVTGTTAESNASMTTPPNAPVVLAGLQRSAAAPLAEAWLDFIATVDETPNGLEAERAHDKRLSEIIDRLGEPPATTLSDHIVKLKWHTWNSCDDEDLDSVLAALEGRAAAPIEGKGIAAAVKAIRCFEALAATVARGAA